MPICSRCNDTHRIINSRGRGKFCSDCPIPCVECADGSAGAFCKETPCSCSCHGTSKTATEIVADYVAYDGADQQANELES